MKAINFILLFTLLVDCTAQITSNEKIVELRGTWLTNVDSRVLESRESIAEAMQFLADHHFNVVYPVVWNKALTLYKSQTMDSIFGISIDTLYGDRDPLAEVIEEAHQRDIAVIAWFEFGFACSYKENGGHIIKSKPYWAAKDKQGRLLEKNGFEWLNAYHPEVQHFLLSLIKEVVLNYNVDGVQGDDRLPAQPSEGGYSEYTVNLYQQEHDGKKPPQDHKDPEWLRWRADKLNLFVKRVYESVKAIEPSVLVTWSPSVYPWAYEEYLQDWPTWIRNHWADLINQQNYRYTFEDYRYAVNSQTAERLGLKTLEGIIFPGILMKVGDYLIEENFLAESITYNRSKNLKGEVFFFYEGLREQGDRLATFLVQNQYKNPAKFPFPRRKSAARE